MALTYTPAGELGGACPDFCLPSVEGPLYSLKDFAGSPVLCLIFMCNHCPYVKAVEDRILDLARDLKNQKVQFVGICANDPQDNPEDDVPALRKRWEEKKYPFPYLYDHEQSTSREFGAVCTPDYFVYDQNRCLAYRGRLDDSWKNPALVQHQELKNAVAALLAGQRPSAAQFPSMGCSIKWKTDV
jgi:peroxiredoxin